MKNAVQKFSVQKLDRSSKKLGAQKKHPSNER